MDDSVGRMRVKGGKPFSLALGLYLGAHFGQMVRRFF
jgi:hypothetical protein